MTKPSWYEKKYEEMNAEEKVQLEERAHKFILEKGNLSYVSYKSLTKEEKIILDKIKVNGNFIRILDDTPLVKFQLEHSIRDYREMLESTDNEMERENV